MQSGSTDVKRTAAIFIAMAGLLLAVGLWGLRQVVPTVSRGDQPLVIYCAASSRAALDEIIAQYRQEYAREVQVEYGPSQTLLNRIQLATQADLYIPADDSFLDMAAEKGLVAEQIPLANIRAVLAVVKGNPKAISRYDDLLKQEVRVVQADPEAAAIGMKTREILSRDNLWQPLKQATLSFRSTVTDIANDLKLGAADVGIVYDVVLTSYPQLEALHLPELDQVTSRVSVGVLKATQHSQAALHFARYMSAADRGLVVFKKHGFQTTGGDRWADRPQLTLFAGAMLRPAIESSIKRFEEREGIDVATVFNGCGILVGQMQTGQLPDAYFACDKVFMQQVSDLFLEPVEVSQNQLVIVVPKGNPRGIASLKDLAKPDLRVGIGHEKQCAMGWITQITLREGGVQEQVMKNVTTQTPTGDLLVNQMLAGSLDAAVVYLSNAAGVGDRLDAVQIQDLPCSKAIQPWAVQKNTDFPQAAGRLFEALISPAGKADFEAEGFHWQLQSVGPQ
jgi:molybdate transport system substrate-binding protein